VTRKQTLQLRRKLALNIYTVDEAFEIVLWLQHRSKGYK
jgi:hypothetical protein